MEGMALATMVHDPPLKPPLYTGPSTGPVGARRIAGGWDDIPLSAPSAVVYAQPHIGHGYATDAAISMTIGTNGEFIAHGDVSIVYDAHTSVPEPALPDDSTLASDNAEPSLLIDEVDSSADSTQATIRWTDQDEDDDASVSLYYDTDTTGFDGTVIVTGLSEDDETDAYVWDLSDVPAGAYYVYGEVDDGGNAPVSSYWMTPVVVPGAEAPALPTGLEGAAEDGGINLIWQAAVSADAVEGYALYWTDRPTQPAYPNRVIVGDAVEYVLNGLELGRSYRVAVVAYDAETRESALSEPVEIALLAPAGANPPQIVSDPLLSGVVGEPYTYSAQAQDVDGDDIIYSLQSGPDGSDIDAETGSIAWTPADAQEGPNSFHVTAGDETGQVDEQTFSVVVVIGANRDPEVSIGVEAPVGPVRGAFTIHWSASDADGDELTIDLQYSVDDDVTVLDLARGLSNVGAFVWDTTTVSDGTYRLAIRASDGDSITTDFMDGSITIENAPTPWDVNGDGSVDIVDLVIVALDFGVSEAGLAGDINRDGVVDIVDLVTVATRFGERTTAPAMAGALPKTVPIAGLTIHPVLDGDTLHVEVRSEGIPGLYGYQFTPVFDATHLRLVAADDDALLGRDGDSFWRQVAHPPASGAPPTIVATRLGPGDGVSRPGALTTFTFRVLRPFSVAQTAFGLRDVKLVDARGAVIARSRGVTFPLGKLMVPATSSLLPNYPNPFNPETWMPFDLSEAADVTVTVYNAMGARVRRIELGGLAAGAYRAKQDAAYWDGRNTLGERVASGVYVYELRAREFRAIRRMLVRK
ncbi:hypothetical protein HN371_29060 [Candidatus Poribacteria bacterium]|nr:hypothetical protein [Candidatus Poribacteria bacterium]MBT5536120.1 hypothetical protein [Candidatus Poribacteria bacterium]MBT5714385.1 hypothetical protein [Candidatus Poribacteria bacterium]MBT7097566.1 hypothetical protein [Candidatus Poribacteria bacterium]MBT7804871.1 hypothetical protein [Candidatus Poribacteria bacterium]